MAVKLTTDELQKTLPGITVNERLTNWLWFTLQAKSIQAYLGDIGSLGCRPLMAKEINKTPGLARHIEEISRDLLIPEKNLQWITNDKRQNLFLMRKLSKKSPITHITQSTSLTGRDLTIATIDIWEIGISIKTDTINLTKLEWEAHSSIDHIYKWFDDDEKSQKLALAWEIISRKFPNIAYLKNEPREKYDLLILLDSPELSRPEKILLIDSIKKRWSQNKYRAKQNGKNQYNFILSDRAISRLDKLATRHEIKRTEVLEILLKMEEENGNYIVKHLNRLSDL